MSIHFFHEEVSLPAFSQSKIINWIDSCIKNENMSTGNINYIFVSDNYLLKINKQYLGHDYYTDIITFDYCKDGIVNGDIFLSIPRIMENAKIFNQDFYTELFRVMIHGILHLTGFQDKTEAEKKQMREKEEEALKKLNIQEVV